MFQLQAEARCFHPFRFSRPGRASEPSQRLVLLQENLSSIRAGEVVIWMLVIHAGTSHYHLE